MIKIRAYQPGDAAGICQLLTKYSDYKRDEAFWLWINRIWPDSSSIVAVAEEGSEIIGHYAILPKEFSFDGKCYRGGLGVHAFVAPPFRSKIPIFAISKYCYKLAKESGIQLIWGFPNQNYRLIQEKVEKWLCVSQFRAFERLLTHVPAPGYTLKSISLSDPKSQLQLNNLLEKNAEPQLAQVSPTLVRWLRRYHAHPQEEYQFHMLRVADSCCGVVVTKVYAPVLEEEKIGHIVDYSVLDDGHLHGLLATIEAMFLESGIGKAVNWPVNKAFQHVLEGAGYLPNGFETYFGIKLLDANFQFEFDALAKIENWNLNMGMSDVF